MKPWRKRLNISVDTGNDKLIFLSKSGLHLATGYTRVVIGKRGPYVEFQHKQIQWGYFEVPDGQEYRWHDSTAFYVEFRSKCASNVMLYYQKRTVSYADYKVGMFYMSPADLVMQSTCPVVSA